MKFIRSPFLYFLLLFTFAFLQPTLVSAGGNVFDSLQGDHTDGVSNQNDQPAGNALQDTPPAPAMERADEAGESQPAQINMAVDPRLVAIIQQILSQFGYPPGTRVVIIPPTGTDPGTGGGGTTPTPTPTPTTGGTSTGPVKATAEAKSKFKSKWGINPLEGDTYWSEGQLAAADEVMARLPAAFRGCTKEVIRERDIPPEINPAYKGKVYGFVDSRNPQRVHMLSLSAKGSSVAAAKSQFQGTLVHEMGHCFQFTHPDIYRAFAQKFWGSGRPNPPSVSGYGNTQPAEDMSESIRTYYQAGARMRASQPDRYNFIKNYVMSGKEFI